MDPSRRLFLSLALEVVFAIALLALRCSYRAFGAPLSGWSNGNNAPGAYGALRLVRMDEGVVPITLRVIWGGRAIGTDCPRVGTGEPASIRLRRATPQLSFGVAASGGLAINYPLTMNRRSLDRWDEWARVELQPIPQARAPFLIVALESPEPCVGATGSQRTSRLLAGSAAQASCRLSTDVG